MTISTEDWKYRIINASPIELVGINFELILLNIDKCCDCLKNGDIAGFYEFNKDSQNFLMELVHSLDRSEEISTELLNLYFYANKLLVKGFYKKNAEPILEARAIMEQLMKALMEAGKNIDDSIPVMENSQQVYSGLTYGKNSLNDSVDSSNRGFKA